MDQRKFAPNCFSIMSLKCTNISKKKKSHFSKSSKKNMEETQGNGEDLINEKKMTKYYRGR